MYGFPSVLEVSRDATVTPGLLQILRWWADCFSTMAWEGSARGNK